MAHTKTEIENAIIAALAPLHINQGGRVKKIEGYQGELDAESIEQLVVVFPMILPVYLGSGYVQDAYPFMVETLTYGLVIGDRNLRGNAAARTADPQGVYGLLVSTRQLLHGKRLGLSIDTTVLTREVALAQTKTLALYSQEYQIVQRIRD